MLGRYLTVILKFLKAMKSLLSLWHPLWFKLPRSFVYLISECKANISGKSPGKIQVLLSPSLKSISKTGKMLVFPWTSNGPGHLRLPQTSGSLDHVLSPGPMFFIALLPLFNPSASQLCKNQERGSPVRIIRYHLILQGIRWIVL